MDHYISSSSSAGKRMARRFALDAADGLRTEANVAERHATYLIAALRSAGAGALSIGAVKDAITDAFGDIQGAINRTLDNEGLEAEDHQIDLSEIEAA